MTALLDKLRMKGKGLALPQCQARQAQANRALVQSDSDEADPNQVDRGDLRDPHAILQETQLADSSVSTRPMTFTYPPGSTPLPRYTIRRGIGIGGFGEVYFAVSDAGKEVALKRIQRNLEIELRGVSHCLNLKHPNLVALYDICRDDQDQSWVVMEYVAGANLRQILDDAPDGLPVEEVRRWFQGIAAGVQHLHSAGLVHRDLKPGNVFDDLGIVKVGDYGLSKYISASHRGGHTESVGTFHYMAPEIGRGQYGREIDVYALGVMLYELLTGKVPFDGESCHEIIVKHLTATPELDAVDEPFRSTIAKCLQKDPAKRFASVDAMAASLGLDVAAQPSVRLQSDRANVSPSTQDGVAHDPGLPPVDAELVAAEVAPTESRHAFSPSPGGSDEPFARAVRHSVQDLQKWWASLDRSPGAKAFLMLVAAFVVIVNTHWLLPMLSVLAIFYVPYYIVRQMVLHVRQQPSYAEAQRIARASGGGRIPVTRNQWRSYMRADLRAKHSIHRLAELNTSWVVATISSITLALLAGIIGLRSGPIEAVTVAPYAWMALVVGLASAGILGLGKFWERGEGESLPRRMVLAGLGVGVGLAAFWVHQFLMLPWDEGLGRDINTTTLPHALYPESVPSAGAIMAHFALLFAILRWWKPVDPLRRTRLSLWAVAVAVVAEWGVHQILPIPQPCGMLIAGGISITIQLSAPWINPRTMSEPTSSQLLVSARPANVRSLA